MQRWVLTLALPVLAGVPSGGKPVIYSAPAGMEIVYGAGTDGRLVAKRNASSRAFPYRDGIRIGLPPKGWSAERWYWYDAWIVEAAQTYGLDPALVKAILLCESGFNPRAKSRAGAMGIGQIMPGTAKRLGVTNPYDPHECIWGTCAHLRRTADYFHTLNMAVLVSAYNAGDWAVEKHLLSLLHRSRKEISPAEALKQVSNIFQNLASVVPVNKETPHYNHDVLWCWDRIHRGVA